MEFHKFPFAVLIYIGVFAIVCKATSNQYSGVSTFIDAISYSFTTTFSIKNNEINPQTDLAKNLHIIQKLIAFISLYSTGFMSSKNLIRFGIINIVILASVIMIHSNQKNANINTDLIYKFSNNHTLTEINTADKSLAFIHMLIVVFIIYKFNKGIFRMISNPLFGRKIKQLNTIAKLD